MAKLTLYSGEYVISCHGRVSRSSSPGKKVAVLADGSVFSAPSYKKITLSFQINLIDKENLEALLEQSDKLFYLQDQDGNRFYFHITSDISFSEYEHFPGYFSASFQGRQA